MSDEKDESLRRAGFQEPVAGPPLVQKAIAEMVGTFTLVFIGAGSIIALTSGGADSGALVGIALAHGLAIATMVSSVGHISGAHFNPAVTFGALITNKIPLFEAGVYVVAQLAGACLGAIFLQAAIPESLWEGVNLGTPGLDPIVSTGQGLMIEMVLTFLLVWVVFATAVDPAGAFGKIAGLSIGLTVAMDILMGGPFTGAAMNPARWFGPALMGGFWDDGWVYIAGPLIGGGLAALLYQFAILQPRRDRRRT